MRDFPPRVTLSEDGVYRWSYDMDLWRNLFMLKLVLKVLAVLCAVLLFIMAAAAGGLRGITPPVLAGLMIVPACLFALTLLIYAACALFMRGTYRLRYEMDGNGVTLVWSDAAKRRNGALAAVAAAAGAAAGRGRKARRAGAMLAAAEYAGVTAFSEVSRVKTCPECDVINLYEWLTMNQIYVNPEDYAFVRDYILARVPEKARRGSA